MSHSSAVIARATGFPSLAPLPFDLPELTGTTIASTVLVLVVTLLVAEQSYWRWRRGKLPGWDWQIVSSVQRAPELIAPAHHRPICREHEPDHGGLQAMYVRFRYA